MGRIFNVPEAVQWGLIHEAVPAFELDDRVTAIAMHLAQSSQQAISAGLEFVRKTIGMDPVSAAPIALEMRRGPSPPTILRRSRAFREKRRPNFFKSPGTQFLGAIRPARLNTTVENIKRSCGSR